MDPYNVLFICQHNVFRSQIAEAYFNQKFIPNTRARSGGLFPHDALNPPQVEIAKQMGIELYGQPKGITTKILGEQDLVVIVADVIPKEVIAPNVYGGPIQVWDIADEPTDHGDKTRRIINSIRSNVDQLEWKISQTRIRRVVEHAKE